MTGDADDNDDVAARLRDKIRSQAAQLLDKVDRIRDESSSHYESPIKQPKETEAASSTLSSPSTSSLDLTKRLQQLAVDRKSATTSQLLQNNASLAHLRGTQTFEDLQLPSHLLKAVYEMGFDRPSAIQEAALPHILQGSDFIGQAQSGSGM